MELSQYINCFVIMSLGEVAVEMHFYILPYIKNNISAVYTYAHWRISSLNHFYITKAIFSQSFEVNLFFRLYYSQKMFAVLIMNGKTFNKEFLRVCIVG